MVKIPIERLHSEMKKIIDEYADDVAEGVSTAVKTVAQKGSAAVRANARGTFGGTGKYAKSWTYELEESRFKTTATIHSKLPGLPHLLENGHAKRGGGRVMGRVHIAPVETEINQTIEKAILREVNIKK